jgi:CubicO group peptidase (beta-lactamase class C family)
MTSTPVPAGWEDILSRLGGGQTGVDVVGLARLMGLCRLPGCSIAVAEDTTLWAAGYGTIAADSSVAVSARTAFQACSISKHVAAFGALRLVSDGVLALDTDVNDYLVSWQMHGPDGGQPTVTLRQLLAHTAGLSYNWFRWFGPHEPVPTMAQVLRGQPPANTPPVRASLLPGSQFRYSGSHYAVLQQLLVDVTDTPFDELMRDLVLDPVGMADSSFDQSFPDRRSGLVASGHHSDGATVRGGWRRIPEMAGAGLWTTPADLVRLEQEIMRAAGGRSPLLTADLAAQMLTTQVPGGYGLGTALDVRDGCLRFGHDGRNIGFSCFSFAWPSTGVAVAVMTNAEDPAEVLGAVLAVAEQRYRTPEPTPDVTPAEAVGVYLLRDSYAIEVTGADGQLAIRVAGRPLARLLPQSQGRCRVEGLDCQIGFRRTDDGRPAMQISQAGNTFIATRKE